MGDRAVFYTDCPKCRRKGTVEVFDAPSSLLYSEICCKCDWKDNRDYYQKGNNLYLLTKKEAKKRKLI